MESAALAAGEFKATCLSLMDEVAATGREIVITKRGKPVAKLVPYRAPKPVKSILGALAHTGIILGDIVSPTPEYWEGWPSSSDPFVQQAVATKPARKGRPSRSRTTR